VTGGAFGEALRALVAALDELGAPAAIIGGVAVIVHGVPRATVDVDATVSAREVEVEQLARALVRHGIEPRVDGALALARTRHVFLGRHLATGIAIDVSLAWLPFEEEAIAKAEERDVAGTRARVVRPEDLLIYKLVAARPRDLDDAENLLVVHGQGMNLRRVRSVVAEFAAVLEDEERPATLQRLLRKTGLA
jgi:hypothetical protein